MVSFIFCMYKAISLSAAYSVSIYEKMIFRKFCVGIVRYLLMSYEPIGNKLTTLSRLRLTKFSRTTKRHMKIFTVWLEKKKSNQWRNNKQNSV